MALRRHQCIPSDEELTVPEVKLSAVVLRSAAMHLGKYCEGYNNEFILCREETQDISACLSEGKAVTQCTMDFFRLVKNNCAEEFKSYYNCIDRSSSSYRFTPCRKTQKVFDDCMDDKLDISRPAYGYFCRVKVHETNRPKPEEEVLIFDAASIPDKLPPDYPEDGRSNKYGRRGQFGN